MASSDNNEPVFQVQAITKKEQHDCYSCGSPVATAWSTRDGVAWLCRECATLEGLGCP